MRQVVVVAAKRTPQGRFLGALAGYSDIALGAAAGEAALTGVDPSLIDEVIVGSVLTHHVNLARMISVTMGLPDEIPAFTVNMACASGLLAVMQAADAIRLGRADVVLCGGAESMSNVPHYLEGGRQGYKLGDARLIDGLLVGLSDPMVEMRMGDTAERLAEQYAIGRETQDAYALRSHQKAVAAQAAGSFADELAPLPELAADEHPRPDTSLDKLSTLRPAFKAGGTVTPGNASGINDAAAMLVLCAEDSAVRHGWRPLARVAHGATAGCDPRIMGIGPVHAVRKLCERHQYTLDAFDTIELNEAFAAQALACCRALELEPADGRLNPEGGAIALGHPVGASGARLAVHLSHRIARGETRQGLATLCVGGGMGAAAVLEAV